MATQYNDSSGQHAAYNSHFGESIVDTQAFPASGCKAAEICLSDEQLRAELARLIKANSLPVGLSTEYFILTPPGVESCYFDSEGFEQCSAGTALPAFCAYHGSIATAAGPIIFSNDPYVTGKAGCDDGNHPTGKPSDGVLQGGLTHEHIESLTDPLPFTGWNDWAGSGGEIGDKCRTFTPTTEFGEPLGKAADGAKFNQVINGHDYWYQQEWSNQNHECAQRLTFAGEEPTATFKSTALSGTTVSLDASESSAPAKCTSTAGSSTMKPAGNTAPPSRPKRRASNTNSRPAASTTWRSPCTRKTARASAPPRRSKPVTSCPRQPSQSKRPRLWWRRRCSSTPPNPKTPTEKSRATTGLSATAPPQKAPPRHTPTLKRASTK